MPSPTIADAIALLTDPRLRDQAAERIPGFVPMRAGEIIDRLAGPDEDRVNARTLVAEALAEIGGLDRSHWPEERTDPRSGSRSRPGDFVEEFWTPESAFRTPTA